MKRRSFVKASLMTGSLTGIIPASAIAMFDDKEKNEKARKHWVLRANWFR